MGRKYYVLIILLVLSASCHNNQEKPLLNKQSGNNRMEELNSFLVQKDRERIQNYAERKKLTVTESATGLWYQIYSVGEGKYFKDNDKVIFNYECSLLDGTVCYSSEKTGPKEVVLGKSKLEPGMYEALRMMKPGGAATFILPPFMAYGLIGDGKMIPSRAVIIYNVDILRPE
jgi:FKBP-type peptidyl-prolyl cis-trans isomerase FkpA